jgi:hypothetical protein
VIFQAGPQQTAAPPPSTSSTTSAWSRPLVRADKDVVSRDPEADEDCSGTARRNRPRPTGGAPVLLHCMRFTALTWATRTINRMVMSHHSVCARCNTESDAARSRRVGRCSCAATTRTRITSLHTFIISVSHKNTTSSSYFKIQRV